MMADGEHQYEYFMIQRQVDGQYIDPLDLEQYDMLIPDKEEGLGDDPYDVDSQDSNREDHE